MPFEAVRGAVNAIEVRRIGTDVAVVTLYGEHDLSTKDELVQQLDLLVGAKERVVVDLSQAEYIDSSVLNSLVHADSLARQHGLMVTLQFEAESSVARMIEITCLRDYLPCADSRDEAVRIARSGEAR